MTGPEFIVALLRMLRDLSVFILALVVWFLFIWILA